MKYLLIFLIIVSFIRCDEERKNKWVLNGIHPGVVIDAWAGTDCLKVIDSGNVYTAQIDHAIWSKIWNGDTIVNFK